MHGRDLPQFKDLPIGNVVAIDDARVRCVSCGDIIECAGCYFNATQNQICPIDFKMNSIGSRAFCMDVHRSDGKHVKFVRVR